MNNLWEEKNIKQDILNLYFRNKKPIAYIYKMIPLKYNLKLSNTKIKKDIGRIIHRKSEDLKFNRKSSPLGICPICGKNVYARDRTKQKEKIACICEGVYQNKCYFRITKKSYGVTLYNNVLEDLLKNKQTRIIKNLIYKNKRTIGYLLLDTSKKGFISIKELQTNENERLEVNKS